MPSTIHKRCNDCGRNVDVAIHHKGDVVCSPCRELRITRDVKCSCCDKIITLTQRQLNFQHELFGQDRNKGLCLSCIPIDRKRRWIEHIEECYKIGPQVHLRIAREKREAEALIRVQKLANAKNKHVKGVTHGSGRKTKA